MTKDELIDMAIRAGFWNGLGVDGLDELSHFAKLVAEKEREACAKLIAKLTEMLEIQQKLHEAAIDMLKPAIEAEREACAELCMDLHTLTDGAHNYYHFVANQILERGEA